MVTQFGPREVPLLFPKFTQGQVDQSAFPAFFRGASQGRVQGSHGSGFIGLFAVNQPQEIVSLPVGCVHFDRPPEMGGGRFKLVGAVETQTIAE